MHSNDCFSFNCVGGFPGETIQSKVTIAENATHWLHIFYPGSHNKIEQAVFLLFPSNFSIFWIWITKLIFISTYYARCLLYFCPLFCKNMGSLSWIVYLVLLVWLISYLSYFHFLWLAIQTFSPTTSLSQQYIHVIPILNSSIFIIHQISLRGNRKG